MEIQYNNSDIFQRIRRHAIVDLDHDNDRPYEESAVIAKGTAMACLFLAAMLFGLIPFKLVQWFKWSVNASSVDGTKKHAIGGNAGENSRAALIISLLLAFGGGVLLSTTFLHLLPEVGENLVSLQNSHLLPQVPFHLAELLMCIGFFLMYLLEELVHVYLHKHQKHTNKHEKAFQRGQSIRNSVLLTKRNVPAATVAIGKPMINCISTTELIPTDCVEQKYRSTIDESTQTKITVPKESYYYEHQQQYHHHHQHQHHSHLPPPSSAGTGTGVDGDGSNGDFIVSSLRGLLIVLALSIHELFEGLAVGLERSTSNVWYMFGAVAAHKLVLAFCVGLELIVIGTKKSLAMVYIITFAGVSPIGIGIGILITGGQSDGTRLLSALLQGLSCGTLLYVVFFEILQKTRTGLLQVAAVFIGFSLMFGLQFIAGHEHSHDHIQHEHRIVQLDSKDVH